MKPTDIITCLERKHQDGSWRLFFFENLWTDPMMNIPPTPVLSALGAMGERNHMLFWVLANIHTTNNEWLTKPALMRKKVGTPHADDHILTKTTDTETFLFKGLPTPKPTWHQPDIFGATSWYWIDGETALSDRYKNFDYNHVLKTWVTTFNTLILLLDELNPLLGLWSSFEEVTQNPEFPLTAHKRKSAHDKLLMTQDMNGLLPASPATTRLIIGFD